MGGNENRGRCRGRGNAGERRRAQQERHRQRAGAIGPDPAVAHDLELAFARSPAESVGDVREPVFMQAPGHDQGRRDRQAGGGERRQAGQTSEPIDRGGDQADDRARDRERPAGAGEIGAGDGCRMRDRQPGAEQHRGLEIARELLQRHGGKHHHRASW